jgi:hypothetical protein
VLAAERRVYDEAHGAPLETAVGLEKMTDVRRDSWPSALCPAPAFLACRAGCEAAGSGFEEKIQIGLTRDERGMRPLSCFAAALFDALQGGSSIWTVRAVSPVSTSRLEPSTQLPTLDPRRALRESREVRAVRQPRTGGVVPQNHLEDTPPPIAWSWMAAPLLAVFAMHLAVLGRYGIGWDELYYVACADHLDWGYVDHPPFIAFVTAVTRFLLGDSLPALRLPSLLAGLVAAFVTGFIAREFGAGRFGQFLATTCVALAPASLVIDHLLSMNAFDHLFWALAILIVARILRRTSHASGRSLESWSGSGSSTSTRSGSSAWHSGSVFW